MNTIAIFALTKISDKLEERNFEILEINIIHFAESFGKNINYQREINKCIVHHVIFPN